MPQHTSRQLFPPPRLQLQNLACGVVSIPPGCFPYHIIHNSTIRSPSTTILSQELRTLRHSQLPLHTCSTKIYRLVRRRRPSPLQFSLLRNYDTYKIVPLRSQPRAARTTSSYNLPDLSVPPTRRSLPTTSVMFHNYNSVSRRPMQPASVQIRHRLGLSQTRNFRIL